MLNEAREGRSEAATIGQRQPASSGGGGQAQGTEK
jgi:hypothetical protein